MPGDNRVFSNDARVGGPAFEGRPVPVPTILGRVVAVDRDVQLKRMRSLRRLRSCSAREVLESQHNRSLSMRECR